MPEEILFAFYALPAGGFEAWATGYPIDVTGETVEASKINIQAAVRRHFVQTEVLLTVRLIAVPSTTQSSRRLDSAKGEFVVPDDFNDPLPKEIEDLFYDGPIYPQT